jgi:hypothetical protein
LIALDAEAEKWCRWCEAALPALPERLHGCVNKAIATVRDVQHQATRECAKLQGSSKQGRKSVR